jgi:hypothetical protein
MQYHTILGVALVPTILLLLLSLVSVALTTHYWIMGDYIISPGVSVTTNDFDQRAQSYRTDFTIVYFQDAETDTTIASGVLCLATAITAIIGWSVLRGPGMDTQIADVYAAQLLRYMLLC